MADWIACPGCGLKHSARPDGTCPRCGVQVAAATGASSDAAGGSPLPPQVAMLGYVAPGEARPAGPPAYPPSPAAAAPDAPLPLGARVAGAVLLANAVVGLGVFLAGRSGGPIAAPFAVGTNLVDLILAVGLLSSRAWARAWALVRTGLGGLIFTPLLWMSLGPLFGLLQLAFSLGVLALLVGEAGPVRLAAGLAGSGGTLALLALMAASPPAGRAVRALAADVAARGGHLEAVARAAEGTWRLPLPPDRWHEPLMPGRDLDGGASWPEEDAHLVVVSRPLPAGASDRAQENMGAVADGAIRGMAAKSRTFVEKERVAFPRAHGAGLAVRAAFTELGQEVEAWLVVIVEGDRFAFVGALAPAERFEELGGELLQLAQGIEL
jgi:hypothetical protein